MNIEQVENKIAEQQGIILEAQARLEAWLEVHASFRMQDASEPRALKAGKGKSPRKKTMSEYIYGELPSMKGKFTSNDLVDKVKARILSEENLELSQTRLSTAVCSALYAITHGKTKNPPVKVKTSGKRDGRKLYSLE